ncbi:MAG TPA: BglII/BstYI family type II restriction endonuclease [Gemmobacter sp.]|nr:BglII/BstYI family type II restriction endonuclease [Gemmobacter sp.]
MDLFLSVCYAHKAQLEGEAVFETKSYDDPTVLPPAAREHWVFMETNSASAIIKAVCPREWTDIVEVLSTYRLAPNTWLVAGGNRGDIAAQIDGEFHKRGWRETRLDLSTHGILFAKDGTKIDELPPIYQEGYLVDNFKNRIVLDVEWNAKDGNLDRDLAAYRSWFDAGVITAGVIITKDRLSLLSLARRIWADYQATLPEAERVKKLPIDLKTSTVTAFDKAQMRVRRGVMGSCPVLIVAATEATWDGQPFT